MMKHLFSLIMVLLSIYPIYAQNRVIQGKVIDEHKLKPIPYADIIINDSIKIGRTGLDGCFQFETSTPVNKLAFRYIEMEPADLQLSDDCNYIELIMVWFPNYCFDSFRKINKKRRKKIQEASETTSGSV